MDIATIVGLIFGIGLIGGSMVLASSNYGLSIQSFWNLESMLIVLGGTLSATAIAFRLNEVKRVFGLIGFVFKKPTVSLGSLVDDLVDIGTEYRQDPKSLEQKAQNVNYYFLKDGLMLIAMGSSLDDLKTILFTREEYRERREIHKGWDGKCTGRKLHSCSRWNFVLNLSLLESMVYSCAVQFRSGRVGVHFRSQPLPENQCFTKYWKLVNW